MQQMTKDRLTHEIIMLFVLLKEKYGLIYNGGEITEYVDMYGERLIPFDEAVLFDMELDVYREYCEMNGINIKALSFRALTFDRQLN